LGATSAYEQSEEADTVTEPPEHIEFAGAGLRLAAYRWLPRRINKGTVLLIHGGGQTRHSWRSTGSRLASDGWTAIAIDLRGHGDSQWHPDGDYGLDSYVRDVHAVCESIRERPVLVGASIGGLACLVAQGEQPALARGLVLVDISPRIEPEGATEVVNFMRKSLAGFDTIDEAAASISAYNEHRSQPPRPDALRKNLRKSEGRWYWHWDPRVVRNDSDPSAADAPYPDHYERSRQAAQAVTAPTLLIRGAASRVVSTAGANELLELIPGSEYTDVSGAGHMVSGDDNDVFCTELINFLNTRVQTGRHSASIEQRG
jgi:pimeloyl-ACP methyl ester carboxylesterase